MPKSPPEPTNLVLEQLRLMCTETSLMRAEMKERFDRVDARFDDVYGEIHGLKREIRGFKLGTIAEIYKANLTVASFVDLERRVSQLEEQRR